MGWIVVIIFFEKIYLHNCDEIEEWHFPGKNNLDAALLKDIIIVSYDDVTLYHTIPTFNDPE